MRRKKDSEPSNPSNQQNAPQGGQSVPAPWEAMPIQPADAVDEDPFAWQDEVLRGSVPPPRRQSQYPPGYYQQPPPQVHYIAPPAPNVPVQQTVVVHTKGRGCFGTLFQVVGFIVVALIVILILMVIF